MTKIRVIDPEAKKASIIRVATSHFARRGFDGASTAEIAKDADVSVGTIFRIFPTKEDLANDIFQTICAAQEKINIISGIASPESRGAKESFAALIQGNFARMQNHRNEFIFFEASFGAAYMNNVSNHIAKRMIDQLWSWVSYHQSKGAIIEADAEVTFALTVGGMARLARDSIQRKFEITSKIEQDFVDLCWRAIAK